MRKLLTAAALAALIPATAMAQSTTPSCSVRVDVADGAYALATIGSLTSAPKAQVFVHVPPAAIGGGLDRKGALGKAEVILDVAPKEAGIQVKEVRVTGPYPGLSTPAFAEQAIVVDGQVYGSPEVLVFVGIIASMTLDDLSPEPAARLESDLRAGKKLRLWLLQASNDPNVRNSYSIELMLPDLNKKAGAIAKAMTQVQKDAGAGKCKPF